MADIIEPFAERPLGQRGVGAIDHLDQNAAEITAATTAATTNINVGPLDPRRLTLAPDGSILVASVQNAGGGNDIVLSRLFRDDAPVGQLMATTLTEPKTGSYRFRVKWRDDDGIDVSSLGDDDVTVATGDGTRMRARLVSTDVSSGKVVTATYLVASASGGWSAADSGRYAIRVERRSVRDTQGNVAQQRGVGEFFVLIPPIEAAPVRAVAAPLALNARRAMDGVFADA